MAARERRSLLIVARDTFPLTRVDLTILFQRYLAQKVTLTWLLRGGIRLADTAISGTERSRGRRLGRFARALSTIAAHLRALREISGGEFDAVQCRDTIIVGALYAVISRLNRVPFVYWMSFPIALSYRRRAYEYFRNWQLLHGASRWVIGALGQVLTDCVTLPLATHIFVQSDLMKSRVARIGVAESRMTAVPMGVDLEQVAACDTPAIHPAYAGRRVIVYVGTLDQERQLGVPFAAVDSVLRRRSDAVLAIIGEASSSEMANVRAMFDPSHLDTRVLFLGHLPLDELFKHVHRADVCLSPVPATPLLDVGTPTKLVEYMALGKRIVANHHPDQTLVLKGSVLGILTEFTATGFEEALIAALDQPPPSQAAVDKARAWVKKHRDYRSLSNLVLSTFELRIFQ